MWVAAAHVCTCFVTYPHMQVIVECEGVEPCLFIAYMFSAVILSLLNSSHFPVGLVPFWQTVLTVNALNNVQMDFFQSHLERFGEVYILLSQLFHWSV